MSEKRTKCKVLLIGKDPNGLKELDGMLQSCEMPVETVSDASFYPGTTDKTIQCVVADLRTYKDEDLAKLEEFHVRLGGIPFIAIRKDTYPAGEISPVFRVFKDILLDCYLNPQLLEKSLFGVLERKRFEKRVIEEKERFQRTMNIMPSGLFAVDAEKKVTYWNRMAEQITGYEAGEVMGKVCEVIEPWPSLDGPEAQYTQEDNLFEQTCQIKRKDGREVTILKNTEYIFDDEDKVNGCMASFTDITKLKDVERELVKLNRAVEQSGSVIMITDLNGRIEYVNPKFTEITGYRAEEVKGKPPSMIKTGEVSEKIYENLWSSISAGLEWRGEFCNKKKNGEVYWEMASISPVKDAEGHIRNYMKVAEDITEKKRYEKKMLRLATFPELNPLPIIETDLEGNVTYLNPEARMTFPELLGEESSPVLEGLPAIYRDLKKEGKKYTVKKLEYSDRTYRQDISYVSIADKLRVYMTDVTEHEKTARLKDEIISTVSHELRTPLAITREGISLILEGIAGDTNERQKKILTTAKNNINRLNRIIDELLDISKLESGKIVIRREMTDIVKVAEKVTESFSTAMKEKKELEIKTEFSHPEIMVYIDPDKIIQVFTNLVANSLRFTERGHVKISVRKKENHVECSVEDTGQGLKRHEIPQVFDKFQQFRRGVGGGDKGAGLGLAITKGIVRLHKGRIRMESEYGRGTTVTFTLPVYSPYQLALECVEKAIGLSQKNRSLMSVVCFKVFPGTMSEEQIKEVFKSLSGVIRKHLRKSEDFVLREKQLYIVGLVECNDIEVIRVAGRLRDRISEVLTKRGLSDKLEIKSGCATYPYDGRDPETLIEKASEIS